MLDVEETTVSDGDVPFYMNLRVQEGRQKLQVRSTQFDGAEKAMYGMQGEPKAGPWDNQGVRGRAGEGFSEATARMESVKK